MPDEKNEKEEKLDRIILRTYEVGFGDCFLLTFQYDAADRNVPPGNERHVLIDFGSTGMPGGMPDQMFKVADDIAARCKNDLAVVVASHRHKDHISGFATDNGHLNKNKESPNFGLSTGEIIKNCKPKMVIQPWTEHPDLAPDAKTAPAASGDKGPAPEGSGLAAVNQNFTKSLHNMNLVSESIGQEVDHLSNPGRFNRTLPPQTVDRLGFLAENNSIRNATAVDNLRTMSSNPHYVNYNYDKLNDKFDLKKILPGVGVRVLGPPDIEQYSEVEKQRSSDREEFWMLYAAAAEMRKDLIDGTIEKGKDKKDDLLFPEANEYQRTIPDHSRWFVRRLRNMRADQLFQIVRILDDAMNNTSVILMFEVGNQKLLFPGDAQIENWEYALKVATDCKENLNLLKDTTFYKVGHHGSRNATPKKLWNTFGKTKTKNPSDVMRTVVSTMAGKHGNPDRHTEVPRQSLVSELESESDYYSTQDLEEKRGLYHDIEIEL